MNTQEIFLLHLGEMQQQQDSDDKNIMVFIFTPKVWLKIKKQDKHSKYFEPNLHQTS